MYNDVKWQYLEYLNVCQYLSLPPQCDAHWVNTFSMATDAWRKKSAIFVTYIWENR